MFKVYPIKEDGETQYFKLKETIQGINLVACDNNGCVPLGGYILSLSEDGIRLFSEVNYNLGIQLDSEKHVLIQKEES